MPEETQGYKLSQPKQSMAEYQQMGESTPLTSPLLPTTLQHTAMASYVFEQKHFPSALIFKSQASKCFEVVVT